MTHPNGHDSEATWDSEENLWDNPYSGDPDTELVWLKSNGKF